jgi:hypothetical protein
MSPPHCPCSRRARRCTVFKLAPDKRVADMLIKSAIIALGLCVCSAEAAMATLPPMKVRPEPAFAAPSSAILLAGICKMAPSYYSALAEKKQLMQRLVSQYETLNMLISVEQTHNPAGVLNRVLAAHRQLRDDVAQRKNSAINDYVHYQDLQNRC